MSSNTDSIESFKSSFHRPSGMIQMNNAGVAPISRPAREAVEYWSRRMYEDGIRSFDELIPAADQALSDLARLVGATPETTALFPSAASSISQVALGFPFSPGDEIVVWDQEYPSNFYPWKVAAERSGAKLVVAKSDETLSMPIEALERVVTSRTKVIAFSWVQYRNGAILDPMAVTKFARERGIFTVSDIIQGAGLMPFDFLTSGLDAAIGGSHKWMVSPIGAGFLCLREEHLEKLSPIMVGAMTYGTPDDLNDVSRRPKTDARRFEPGSKPFLEILALGASVRLLEQTGIARIAQEAEWLSRTLMHGLRERGYLVHSPHGAHFRGAIVNFGPGPDSALTSLDSIADRLNSNGVSSARRPPGVRLAPHAFNTKEEVEQVLEILSR